MGGSVYLPVRRVAETYCQSKSTVRRILEEIRETDRYSSYRITINDDGDKLVNVLIYEDYLYYRTQLKNRNLAKTLPPFDPVEVRKNWGEGGLNGLERSRSAPSEARKSAC